MRSSLLISVAVFFSASCLTNAQRRPEFLGLDSVIESQAFPDLKASDVAIIENALPEVKADVESDILEYAASIATQPEFLSAAAVLASALPTSVQDQLADDPGKFVASLIAATQPPPWVSALPTGIQPYFVNIGNRFASIVNEDADADAESPRPTTLRGSFVFPSDGFVIPTGVLPQGTAGFPQPTGTGALPSGSGRPSGTGVLPSGSGRPGGTGFVTGVNPTGTGTGVLPLPTGGINGTTPTRGQASPIPFAGSASLPLRRSGSAGAAAAFIGAACWLLA